MGLIDWGSNRTGSDGESTLGGDEFADSVAQMTEGFRSVDGFLHVTNSDFGDFDLKYAVERNHRGNFESKLRHCAGTTEIQSTQLNQDYVEFVARVDEESRSILRRADQPDAFVVNADANNQFWESMAKDLRTFTSKVVDLHGVSHSSFGGADENALGDIVVGVLADSLTEQTIEQIELYPVVKRWQLELDEEFGIGHIAIETSRSHVLFGIDIEDELHNHNPARAEEFERRLDQV